MGFWRLSYSEGEANSKRQFTPEDRKLLEGLRAVVTSPLEDSKDRREIAFFPNRLFILGTREASSEIQEKAFEKFKQSLRITEGARVVIGEERDYIELLRRHLPTDKDNDFGSREGYLYTRTKTPMGKGIACVGMFNLSQIERKVWNGKPSPFVALTPLVIPA